MESSIVETKEETMISPTVVDSKPTTRTAHFLKPTIASFNPAPNPNHETPPPNNSSQPSNLKASFRRRVFGKVTNWKLWVENMAAIHKPTWEKAGIFDAVMSSVYPIKRDEELVYRLAEKWCPMTNSFVFPWGEATVTLEDMAVFGLSVSGYPVFLPLEEGSQGIKWGLETAMKELQHTSLRKATISSWMPKFQGSGSPIEHEAFLVAWLSTYVLANTMDSIRKETIPIAIHLARGIRIALAPPVLAGVYRHLSIFKCLIVQSRQSTGSSEDACLSAGLWTPFQMVQVWAWERFARLQRPPKELSRCQPRLARWSTKEKKKSREEVSVVLDSAAGDFIWRPYALPLTNWDFPKFYGEAARWVQLKSGSDDEDLVDLARCVRVSSLVGMDSIEKYFPHRVAMQFGFDQDIPGGYVSNESRKIDTWRVYSADLDGVILYVPPRIFEVGVTTRYQQWWKQQVVELQRIELHSLDYYQKKWIGKKPVPKTAANGPVMPHENGKRNMDDDPEDIMTITELLKAHEKTNGAEDGILSVVQVFQAMVLETQSAERRQKKLKDSSGQSSEHHTPSATVAAELMEYGMNNGTSNAAAEHHTPSATVAAELRESGMNNETSNAAAAEAAAAETTAVVAAAAASAAAEAAAAAAATTPVIKLESIQERMVEVGKGITDNEIQRYTSRVKAISTRIGEIKDELGDFEKVLKRD